MPETTARPLARPLRPEVDLLFSTARVRISPETEDRIRSAVRQNVNWIDLIRLAIQHETTALLYWNLQRICPQSVPAGVLEPLAARYKKMAAEAQSRAEELVHILDAFDERRIFAVAYKGPLLAKRLYGNLFVREFSEFSDLDIMIHERDLSIAREIILDQGYREDARLEREMRFRRARNGARELELHWRFMTQSSPVADDPERFLRRFERLALLGTTVRSLPLDVYFLVLSLHGTKHKWKKLKLIGDVAEILESDNVDWDHVVREAEILGLKRMLAVAVLLAEDPLQAKIPAQLTRQLEVDRVARRLAEECRQNLLKEPDNTWRHEADIRFLFHLRERLSDKTHTLLWEWMWPKTMPDKNDLRFAPLPESLWVLYYLVRPVRLAWKEISERP